MTYMQKIFKEFEKEGIEYAHFKSNCHLDDSFLGDGDFDVLINSNKLYAAERVLSLHNGKRFNSFYYGRYPGVDNWLIFDEETGDIHHFHLHCQIATGKSQVKDYVIPWDKLILETRVVDPEWGIYITDPNLEILLLMVRLIVKSSLQDRTNATMSKYSLHEDLKDEWISLHKKVDFNKVDQFIEMLFPQKCHSDVKRIVRSEEISGQDYLLLNTVVRGVLSDYRRVGGFAASFNSLRQRMLMKCFRYGNNHYDSCHMIKKSGLGSGAILAFVGVDGAGKSTTTKEIQKWLQKKIECHRFYMGEGDGKKGIFVTLLKKAQNVNKTQRNVSDKNTESGVVDKKLSGIALLKKYLRTKMILSLEKRNYKNMIKMNKYRLNGGISLLDRYPQIEYAGCNDGPKLPITFKGYKKEKWMKRALLKEKSYLGVVRRIKPDIVFRLNITAEESMRRKPEQTDISEFQKKIDDLNKLTFQNSNIIDIDASQSYDMELMEIKKEIWACL